MKLSEISRRLDCELQGDGDIEIVRVAGIEKAGPGDLTFVSNKKYLPYLKSTRAAAVILGREVRTEAIASLRTNNPYLAFARAIELFHQPVAPEPGVHPSAVVHPGASIGSGVSIGAHTVIMQGARIEADVVIHANCTVYPFASVGRGSILHSNVAVRERVQIGQRCIIQNGAVIGGDGFGFAPVGDGSYYKIAQAGIAVLEDDVEIGANSAVDRAAVGETRIRKGAKIDNLVQVGHGSDVGENTVLAAQVGLAGSTVVGKNAMLAGQVGVAGHCRIGDRVIATGQSGLHGNVEEGKVLSGSPAFDNADWLKVSILLPRLPEMQRRLRQLEKLVQELLKQP